MGSVASDYPEVMSNQADTTVQLRGQTTEVDLGAIGENHVLGKLERGKNIINEKREKEGTQNRTLRYSRSSSKPAWAFTPLINYKLCSTREVEENPRKCDVRKSQCTQLNKQSRVTHSVKGLAEIKQYQDRDLTQIDRPTDIMTYSQQGWLHAEPTPESRLSWVQLIISNNKIGDLSLNNPLKNLRQLTKVSIWDGYQTAMSEDSPSREVAQKPASRIRENDSVLGRHWRGVRAKKPL